MEKKTQGAWIIHHGKKAAADLRGPAEYSAIDFAAKTAGLLARLGASRDLVVPLAKVNAFAKAAGLNPKTELPACLAELETRRLIEQGASGLSVLGVGVTSAVAHASDIFEGNEPTPSERASIELAELASQAPLPAPKATEYISDTYKFSKVETADFLDQANQIGFVDSEGSGKDALFFNGNLFRKDSVKKTAAVLASLKPSEAKKVTELDQIVVAKGYALAEESLRILGEELQSKIRAAGLYDWNVVKNEQGEHVIITQPGSFHKFHDPFVDDAFDHAKALVAALSYGMSSSAFGRGRIWSIDLLLGKLIRGESVGPATAIGQDYRALEVEGIVEITPHKGSMFFMKLLKRDIGTLALQVLKGKGAVAAAEIILPSAGMSSYRSPEETRTSHRKSQNPLSRTQTHSLLSALRGGFDL